jgi:DksA/TraR C4-type zinc finger protein
MNQNRTIHLVDIPIGGHAGSIWNRLHGEREEICQALLKDHRLVGDERCEWLQARLRKIDDALDRLMAGSYGNCSKCGQAIDETRLEIDPALALCLDCWTGEPTDPAREQVPSGDVVIGSLAPFDTVLLRTHNSDYRILLLDPMTGRALVEGGDYISEPTEALVRGSSVDGDAFKGGTISVGSRLEMWVNDRAFLTSPVKTVWVKHNGDAQSVQDISAALH